MCIARNLKIKVKVESVLQENIAKTEKIILSELDKLHKEG